MVDASVSFAVTGSRTKGNAQGHPQIAQAASWMRAGAAQLASHGSLRPMYIMTPEQAVAFLLFAVAAAGTPGPSNLLLTATGATVDVLHGLPCLLGVMIGMGVMMFVVAFGLGSVVLANHTVLRLLNMGVLLAGSVVLVVR